MSFRLKPIFTQSFFSFFCASQPFKMNEYYAIGLVYSHSVSIPGGTREAYQVRSFIITYWTLEWGRDEARKNPKCQKGGEKSK